MDDRSSAICQKYGLPLGATLAVLLGFGALSVWLWQSFEARNREGVQQRFQLEAQDVGQRVVTRMRAYEMVLRGMSGLLLGSDSVSYQEWERAVDQLQLQDRYPGMQALGWARYLKQEQLDDFLADVRSAGRSDYRVFPPEPRDEYVLIDYISPLDWRNRRALGYDMFSESVRRAAIEQAYSSGVAALTAPLTLKQETEADVQGGVMLYLPVFQAGMPLSSVEERHAALLGFVYGAFRSHDLMAGILGSQSRLFEIAIKDLSAPDTVLLSANQPAATLPSRLRQTLELPLFGRTWVLEVGSTADYEAALGSRSRTFSLWMGLIASGLLALLIGGYLYLRERELSASRLATRQLREREERFRLLIERLPVATLLCNADGRIEMVNRSATELLECPAEALVGERVRRFLPELDDFGELTKEGDTPLLDNDYEVRCDSGVRVPVTLSLSVLAESRGANYVLNLIDLRARKSAEERFRLVVEASPNSIILVDSAGQIAMVNQQTEQMFGYTRQELLGQPVEKLLPQEQHEAHVGFRRNYQNNPEPRRMGSNRDLFGQHRDGRLIPLEVGLSPIRSGEDALVQVVIIDISERKAAEQRLRDQAEQLTLASRYKSEFLANMSHELRTPLNSILILSDQLRLNSGATLTEKQVKHADIVHRAGSDLLQLINSILDLAKVESGRIELKLEPLNLQELLAELDASMRPMAELKGLRLHSELQAEVPRVVHTDRARLQQILRNLLSNACKFTEQGEVNLTVECEPSGDDGPSMQLLFSVRDTGIGIAADQHEQIFQAFQQIDGSTSRRFGGTGLGLAITRQLVQAMGGEISLQSAPAQGACFTLRLPMRVEAPLEGAGAAEPVPRSGVGPAVLIIEDDPNFAAIIIEAAHTHGFTSVHCRTGLQALKLLEEESFSAVILDILLPDISGWQLFRRLRGQVSNRSTPVHIISCVPQPVGWNDDGTHYLVKPIDREDLEQVFIGLQGSDHPPAQTLLLVEDVEVEREHYREHLQQLGFTVTTCSTGEEACEAYAAGHFTALVIDLDLPDQDGFELLESLDCQRPLNGTRVVINTGVDVAQQALQRLRRYSAVVVRKHGEDTQELGQAVQGFLGSVRDPVQSLLAPPLSQPLAGRRVLLVDDDVRNVYAMTALLDEVGIKSSAAKDGLEAIERYPLEPFDLILMDMAMPNMDGYTATRLLKQEHRCSIPIIALTAHAMKGDRDKCIAAGADDYLTKPVSRDELLVTLLRWLNSSEMSFRASDRASDATALLDDRP
ncbi:PAS domain S-box-containing protein [Pseudomonas sp. SJZ079]|uniref:CHASE domain-containing protein n=1 Tax=Pseudomonas sp. SJZ079 TaxID=2572887 RepID=UPI00119A8828|nr:CHASE domain-containing protein [Pseudomonas sp. SJZ079]TWC31352.1 PAS domain S-box-containing protein [Pseudomonas sp. SJZ079]